MISDYQGRSLLTRRHTPGSVAALASPEQQAVVYRGSVEALYAPYYRDHLPSGHTVSETWLFYLNLRILSYHFVVYCMSRVRLTWV